ncbi:MAG TPA: Rieske 2Fe-2S domain-containing protein [bacterium]
MENGFKKAADLKDLEDEKSVEVEVGPLSILLHRRGEQVFATGVHCPHADVRLDPRNCFGDLIICKAHGYKSNIRTGVCLNEPDIKLPTYPTVVENGKVWVKLY